MEKIEGAEGNFKVSVELQPHGALGAPVPYDAHGFVDPQEVDGIRGAGCAKRPVEVVSSFQDVTAASLRAHSEHQEVNHSVCHAPGLFELLTVA